MMRTTSIVPAALVLAMAACGENSALGNDREAHLDPPEPAAEQASAESLAPLAPGLLKPSPFSEADLARLSAAGACRFGYTDVGFPVFVYPRGGQGPAFVKLNGTLIPLPPVGAFEYASGGVRVQMRHPDGLPDAGDAQAFMIVRLAGAPDELGFAGEVRCP